MKTLLTFILLISLPLTTLAQDNSEVNNASTEKELIVQEENKTPNQIETIKINRSTAQNKAIRLNYKKSFELISIKAYRKSLQIKVKTIKNC